MLNFPIPDKIGIGVARGTACKLVSNRRIIDYFGNPLNMAARLSDMAEPYGIIIDSITNIALLPSNIAKLFKPKKIYIKGFAELEPTEVFYSSQYTNIPSNFSRPINEIKWITMEQIFTLREIIAMNGNYVFLLKSIPLDEDKISIRITHPKLTTSKRLSSYVTSFVHDKFDYSTLAGNPRVAIDFDILGQTLKERGIKLGWKVTVIVVYPTA